MRVYPGRGQGTLAPVCPNDPRLVSPSVSIILQSSRVNSRDRLTGLVFCPPFGSLFGFQTSSNPNLTSLSPFIRNGLDPNEKYWYVSNEEDKKAHYLKNSRCVWNDQELITWPYIVRKLFKGFKPYLIIYRHHFYQEKNSDNLRLWGRLLKVRLALMVMVMCLYL